MKNIDIIAACSDLGVNVDGAKFGPETLLNSIDVSVLHKVKNVYNKNINYTKSLDKNDLRKNLNEINSFNKDLYNEVLNTLNNNSFPITLGGDHSIAIASSLASIKKNTNLGIIWFDAHGDYHTFNTTMSGNIHGLPFASVTNYEPTLLKDFHTGPCFNPKNAVLLGGRDIDSPCEIENLKNAGITIITTKDIKKYGIEKMAKKAFDIASTGTNGIHISFDIDVIDPVLAPGVSIPAVNGISEDDAYAFAQYIIRNKNMVKSIDLVEFNPLTDINQITEKITLKILNNFLNNL